MNYHASTTVGTSMPARGTSFVTVLIALLLSSVCAGCRATVKVVHRAPGFGFSNLIAGRLGIGAVAGLGGGEYFLSDNVSGAISNVLAKECPNLVVFSLAETRILLPATVYTNFLNDFSELMKLRAQDFDVFRGVRSKARYVLLVGISGDSVRRGEDRFEQDHYRTVKNAKTGEYESEYDYTDYSVVRSGTRLVEMKFILCDLETEQPVWIANGRADDSASKSSSSTIREPPTPPWPSNPSSMDSIERIVGKAVCRLIR